MSSTVRTDRSREGLATLLLTVVTAIWGSTFFLISDTMERLPAADFLAVRFAVAALVMVPWCWPQLRAMDGRTWRLAAVLGGVYAVAQLLQTEGIAQSSASVSGFVTGMYVVLTPLLTAAVLRERVGPVTWVAVLVATVGLGLLTLRPEGVHVGTGELLVLASALGYAVHIVLMGRWARADLAGGMSAVQMVVLALVCAVGAAPGGIQLPPTAADWGTTVYCALLAGAFAMWAQTWAQSHMPAPRAAIVMVTEPVFAAVFAVWFGKDLLSWQLLVGGGLVMTALLLTEWRAVAEVLHGGRGRTTGTGTASTDTAAEVRGQPAPEPRRQAR